MKNKPLKDPGRYGPGVLDPDDYEAAQAVEKSGSDKYGPGVIDDHPDNQTEGGPEEAPPEGEAGEKSELEQLIEKYATKDGYLSIKDMKALLVEMPSAFDRVFAWELNRADGVRIGALEHLKKVEEEQGEPRVLVIAAIDQALKRARGE